MNIIIIMHMVTLLNKTMNFRFYDKKLYDTNLLGTSVVNSK